MQGNEYESAKGQQDTGHGASASQSEPLTIEQLQSANAGQQATQQAQPDSQLAKAQAEANEYKDLYVRAKAEGENIRRRAQEDIAKAHKFGIENFAESLLPVKDSLEAALNIQNSTPEAYREGMEITLKQLVSAFEKNRMVEIAPEAGAKFDPHLHQAISMVPSAQEPNTVVSTLQKGYSIADRVLRPALVTVSSGAA